MAIGDGVLGIANLGVTFGGFSPTLVNGVTATKDLVENYEALERQRKDALRRQRELAMARASRERLFVDEEGSKWTYVVIDDSVVRIVKCESVKQKVLVPESIEGKPVKAIASDSISNNNYIEEIVCPDSIESIGAGAFRLNNNLRKLVLPNMVPEYQSSWIRGCTRLEELVLPGLLSEITMRVFDNRSLKKLVVGKNVHSIEPGAFQHSALEEIHINDENPFIKSDGTGIYSNSGEVLLAIARPIPEYTVQYGCKVLGRKSCFGLSALECIELPHTAEELEPFALSHTGLVGFKAPDSLTRIGEKAFYYCKELSSIELNSALQSIEESAFEDSGLESLTIPAGIKHIGTSITLNSKIVHSGENSTLEISEGCKEFFLDGQGGLYRREPDGNHLVQLVDRTIREYAMAADAIEVDPYAFAFNDVIESVVIREGVRVIGKSAFRVCTHLRNVELPDSVREIGEEAFIDTRLESFRIPASLESLGKKAIVTYDAHHGDRIPSLARVDVSPENDSFYVASGMLCHKENQGSKIIAFTNSEADVVFPEDAYRIEEFAFNNARGIDYLAINSNLKTIGTCGLTTWGWIRHIHVELAEELKGRKQFDFFFPDTFKSIHGINIGLGGSSWVNVPGIFAQYDMCIANARDYNMPKNPDNITAYEQISLIIERLTDPIMLSEVNRGIFDRLIRWHLLEICSDIARHDDREMMSELFDRGYITKENIDEIIDAVGKLQDAAMTAYLLEAKRLRFNQSIMDFDL